MPYIGSSRYKYSPYLTIYFGKTEKFTAGEPVPPFEGSSTFSQLPVYQQSMALHLSFEESNTYIDHSPANHTIFKWGTGTLTASCSGSVPNASVYSINGSLVVDNPFPSRNIYRPTKYIIGQVASGLGGLTAEGDWRKLFEYDFTIEGYYFDSRDLYNNNGGFVQAYLFNIGDENSAHNNQKKLISIYSDGSGNVRFNIGEISGTETTVLSITGNVFAAGYYFGINTQGNYPGPAPKEMNPIARGTNNWRYWCIEKYGNTVKAILEPNNSNGWRREGSIDISTYNFGALSVPSGLTTASYSVQPHLSGQNYLCQINAVNSGGTLAVNSMTAGYYDDVRITPYARYKGNIPFMGGTRINDDHFPYNDW